jgi:hypothetical protein
LAGSTQHPTLANINDNQASRRRAFRVGGAREFSAFAFFMPQKNQKNISPAHKNRAIDHR